MMPRLLTKFLSYYIIEENGGNTEKKAMKMRKTESLQIVKEGVLSSL